MLTPLLQPGLTVRACESFSHAWVLEFRVWDCAWEFRVWNCGLSVEGRGSRVEGRGFEGLRVVGCVDLRFLPCG